jgi:hypothetical protein
MTRASLHPMLRPAIGNLLRHEYQRADVMAKWNIIQQHLPLSPSNRRADCRGATG